ncbi:MAG: hypothetical protein QXF32_03135 [Candidatus Thermoplasmatota archaeon]
MQLLRYLLKEKSLLIRERKPVEIILYIIFLYLSTYFLRDFVTAIHIFIRRSRTVVWKRIQKFVNIVKEYIADEPPDVAVIDETTLKNSKNKILVFGLF